jgi:hypothetical protein
VVAKHEQMPAAARMVSLKTSTCGFMLQMSHDRGCGSGAEGIADFRCGAQDPARSRESCVWSEQRFVSVDVVGVAVRAKCVKSRWQAASITKRCDSCIRRHSPRSMREMPNSLFGTRSPPSTGPASRAPWHAGVSDRFDVRRVRRQFDQQPVGSVT